MLTYVVKRLLVAVPTLLAVLTVVFFFVRIAPGDPALIILGDQASQQALAAVRHDLGLDQPLPIQYVDFMSTVLKGDLGTSLVTHRPVWGEVANVLPYTIELTLSALVIGVALGLPLGIAAARHRNRPLDYAARIFSLLGLSFPAFVSAIMLLLAFAIELRCRRLTVELHFIVHLRFRRQQPRGSRKEYARGNRLSSGRTARGRINIA